MKDRMSVSRCCCKACFVVECRSPALSQEIHEYEDVTVPFTVVIYGLTYNITELGVGTVTTSEVSSGVTQNIIQVPCGCILDNSTAGVPYVFGTERPFESGGSVSNSSQGIQTYQMLNDRWKIDGYMIRLSINAPTVALYFSTGPFSTTGAIMGPIAVQNTTGNTIVIGPEGDPGGYDMLPGGLDSNGNAFGIIKDVNGTVTFDAYYVSETADDFVFDFFREHDYSFTHSDGAMGEETTNLTGGGFLGQFNIAKGCSNVHALSAIAEINGQLSFDDSAISVTSVVALREKGYPRINPCSGVRYDCDEGVCRPAADGSTGEFDTYQLCADVCEKTFRCNPTLGYCEETGEAPNTPGTYSTYAECEANCDEAMGACCDTNGDCSIETESDCIANGGTFQGASTNCDDPAIACTDRWQCDQATGTCSKVPASTPGTTYATQAECENNCEQQFHCSTDGNGTPDCVPYVGPLPPANGETLYDTHADCTPNCQCCTSTQMTDAGHDVFLLSGSNAQIALNGAGSGCQDSDTTQTLTAGLLAQDSTNYSNITATVTELNDTLDEITVPATATVTLEQGGYSVSFDYTRTIAAGCQTPDDNAPVNIELSVMGTFDGTTEEIVRVIYRFDTECCSSSYQGSGPPAPPMMASSSGSRSAGPGTSMQNWLNGIGGGNVV